MANHLRDPIQFALSNLTDSSHVLLNVSTLLHCASDLLDDVDNDAACKAQALLLVAADLSGIKSEWMCKAVTMLREVDHD
ncbi:hypothetical protein [Paraburkholderia sp. ZP32-5]|uniref:hypothetical protein n=1 Tax=Paraburkholderia sp. ZP32-5 TaxID=2883245 RepID=UPI001F32F68E|nr:hypothetical protein [Paraburkholderia sp. ZP32-5]